MNSPAWPVVLLLLAGCTGSSFGKDTGAREPVLDTDLPAEDADADGVFTPDDCDDADATVFPGAVEACDGVDDDCDGTVDEDAGDAPTWYEDVDADTYGSPSTFVAACEQPAGHVATAGDCDDASAAINPGAAEACGGVDEDCDGETDEAGAVGELTSYLDLDADGFGDPATAALACTVPSGAIADGSDCDDTDATVYPGAPERCDGQLNDCADTSATFEDGLVSFVDPSGAWSDVSATFATATAASTALESGTYNFCAGTYYTKLVASSDTVELVGVHGADVTTLVNNASTGAVVSATNGAVTLTGLTLSEGKGGAGYGGALLVSWTSFTAPTAPHVTVDSCVLSANTATMGGGVALNGTAWVEIVDSTIAGNTATDDGGGIYVDGGAILELENSTVDGNTASAGGGIFVAEEASLTMTDAWLTTNTASYGGGIYLYESAGDLTCTSTGGVRENTADTMGGGVYLNPKTGTTTFAAITCDFGADATDNVAEDVGFVGLHDSYDAGAAATFACVDTACAP